MQKGRIRGVVAGLAITVSLSAVFVVARAQGDGNQAALRAAMEIESVRGDLGGAIAAYQKVVDDPATSPAVAAQALLRQADVHEKLGQKDPARAIYRRIVDRFADRPEAATARTRLGAAGQASVTSGASSDSVVERQLWTGPDVNLGWASADGRFLPFNVTGGIGIRDLAAGTSRRLPIQGSTDDPVLSPDGTHVAYVLNRSELRLIRADGSQGRELFSRTGHYVYEPIWSPDGSRLALTVTNHAGDNTSQIVFIDAVTGAATQLKNTGWQMPKAEAFSRDGRFLVYSVGGAGDEGRDLMAIAVDGSRESLLAGGPSREAAAVLTPDGRAIVFFSNRSGVPSLWMQRLEGMTPVGSPQLLRSDISPDQPIFTTDGRYLYGTFRTESDVFVAGFDPAKLEVTSTAKRLSDHVVGTTAGARWSPDGRRMAFIRGTQRGPTTLVVRSLSDASERTLPTKFLAADHAGEGGHLVWFPDGRSLLVSDLDRVNQRVTYRRIDIDTGLEAIVLEGKYDRTTVYPALATDGRSLYYTKYETELDPKVLRVRLVRRDLASRSEKELYSAVGSGFSTGFWGITESPDGSRLAFKADLAPNQRTLMTLSTAGGTPQVLLQTTKTDLGQAKTAWTPDGKHILELDRKGQLRVFPAGGGEARSLSVSVDGTVDRFDLSPDGRQIAFSTRDIRREVRVLENLLSQLESLR